MTKLKAQIPINPPPATAGPPFLPWGSIRGKRGLKPPMSNVKAPGSKLKFRLTPAALRSFEGCGDDRK